MERRRNLSSFPQYFQNISNFRGQITYSSVKCGCSIYLFFIYLYIFFNSANLLCRGTDILKYFQSPLDFEITRVKCILVCNCITVHVFAINIGTPKLLLDLPHCAFEILRKDTFYSAFYSEWKNWLVIDNIINHLSCLFLGLVFKYLPQN